MNISNADFHTNIIALLNHKGMTLERLCRAVDRNRSAWTYKVKHRPETMTAAELLIIAKVFGLNTEQIGELVESTAR